MINEFGNILTKYFKSFDNTDDGYSRKKLYAWGLIVTAIVLQVFTVCVYKQLDLATTFVTIDLSTAVAIAGINTYQSLNSNSQTQNQTDERTN